MANETRQLNHFSNIDFDVSKNGEGLRDNIRPFKKVNFNTLSSNDYITSEAYKTLRTNIFFCGSEIKTIMITSYNENEGKSTVSTELVKSLAEYGKKSLLIDADMRKSVMLKKSIRASEVMGLSEVLSGLTEPEEAIFNTQDSNFDVMFAGHFPPNPVELIGNGVFASMLENLKKTYDYIIVDTPPLGVVIDAAVIASLCDGAIYVIGGDKVPRKAAGEVCDQIVKSGCRLLGAVINQTEKGKIYQKRYYKSGKEYKSYKY